MDQVLITGWGLLAQGIAARCTARDISWRVVTSRPPSNGLAGRFWRCRLGRDQVDMAALDGVTLVFHTAAMTSVGGCESHVGDAYTSNVHGTKQLVAASTAVGAKVVFSSTDWVFDGLQGGYLETDAVHPLNVYGLTKAWAEEAVIAAGGLVIRGTFLGRRPDGRSGLVEALADERSTPAVQGSRRVSPLWVGDYVESMLDLAEHAKGVMHVGSATPVCWQQFCAAIRRQCLDREDVDELSEGDSIARPRDTSLQVDLASVTLRRPAPSPAYVAERVAQERALLGPLH